MKNNMRFIALSVFVLCFALFAVSASAQTATTGSIEGTVVDVNGAAVPGVTVNVNSPNLISPQSTTTNESGVYRILNLPPGRYNVSVEATKGFAKFEQKDVEVNLSRTSSLGVTLSPEQVGGVVNVTDTAGAGIDVTQNTTGTSVSNDQFSNFPTQRTAQSLYTIAPTATSSGLKDSSGRAVDPSIGGSSGPENNYILDGINTTDPAFGGSGANLPFEFVQEVEIKTGAFGAEYGKSTGGVFNVITKSGGNQFHGDVFGYFTTKGLVREVKNFPGRGVANNGFSEIDAGVDVGGPIKKDKLWFFAAFNPQRRENFFLTQNFREEVANKVTTPFYAGKITYAINSNNTLTFSTFGDFTKQTGFYYRGLTVDNEINGFGVSPGDFNAEYLTGGSNYAVRLNSSLTPRWIGEFAFGLHKQRNTTTPEASLLDKNRLLDTFAILRDDNTVAPVTESAVDFLETINGVTYNKGRVAYVNAPGGELTRGFYRQGFAPGTFNIEARERWEILARLQNIVGPHTIKYGFEYNRNTFNQTRLTGGQDQTFGNPENLTLRGGAGNNEINGARVDNAFGVCTNRTISGLNTIVCPNDASTARAALIAVGAGYPGGAITDTITQDEALNNPFLIWLSSRVRDFQLDANTYTNVESFYVQDDYRITPNVQASVGVRWDYQQAYNAGGGTYIKLNDFKSNLQPRLGFTWDFTGQGKGKLFVNYARYLEAPIPLDVNVRAGGGGSQIDKNFNASRYGAPAGSVIVSGIRGDATVGAVNLGAAATPIDPGIKPPTVNEATAGFQYEIAKDLTFGFRGIYRAQDEVIEDGSFDDGDTYFLFNPGRLGDGTTEQLACDNPAIGCFGPARRYYRALEFTATKRFSSNYQFIASYVYSSLIGNYEGLFRNDNGQADPNITSLFDLVSLLPNTYGRLPNDRPHQLKFDGSYATRLKFTVAGSFRMQSGLPFNQLISHPVYGDNEGFGLPRGTAQVPGTSPGVPSTGTRSPRTYNLDLSGFYPIKFGENRQLRFQVDWFNAFNFQRAVRLDETFTISSGVDGVPDTPNPFYGRGQFFQFPSALRLGVKFQF